MEISTKTNPYDALKNISGTSAGMSKLVDRISSNLKESKVASNADTLTISNKLRSQSQQQASSVRNAEEGVATTQFATNALEETGAALQSMRKLAERSGAEGTTEDDKNDTMIQITALKNFMDFNLKSSNFNGRMLFDGSASSQNSAGSGTGINLNLGKITTETLGIDKIDVTKQSTKDTLSAIDSALEKISATLKNVSGQRDSFMKTLSASPGDSVSKIKDLDMAAETVALVKNQILQQSGTASLAQANQAPQNVLSLLR